MHGKGHMDFWMHILLSILKDIEKIYLRLVSNDEWKTQIKKKRRKKHIQKQQSNKIAAFTI